MSSSPPPNAPFALWLLVPVKPFGEGKSRLAGALPPEGRAQLSQRWLSQLLTTAVTWGRFAGIAVVSRDPTALTLAAAMGALPILEAGDDLNSALAQASQGALAAGAEATLVLPSDLPLLTSEDLDQLYALALYEESVIIAPSYDGGTNALLLRPPEAIVYAFGENSFARHCELARQAGLPCHVYHSTTLALDIDRPEDLLVAKG